MKKRTLVLGIVFLLACGYANAASLTFDGFPDLAGFVPGGYGGLNWGNVYYDNTVDVGNGIATCDNGVVWSQSGDFDFLSSDLTSVWGENITLTVLGLNLDEGQFSVVSGIQLKSGVWVEDYVFDMYNIDTLIFVARNNIVGDLAVLGMDNWEINPPVVPIPATLLLLGSGLLGLIGFRRTMRQ